MKKKFAVVLVTVLTVMALVLTGCGSAVTLTPTTIIQQSSPAGSPDQVSTTGKIEVVVTDAPARENITAIKVKVKSIEVHKAGADETIVPQPSASPAESSQGAEETPGTADSAGSWTTITLSENREFDLLKVKDDPASLGITAADVGVYTQIRLEVESVTVSFEGNGTPVPATVPSGKIKFIHPFQIGSDETTQLVFDFDAAQSVNVTGNGKVIFKPVIRLSSTKAARNTLRITTRELAAAMVGTAYTAALAAGGGKGNYTWSWSVSEGKDLPPGLNLDPATGVISGTPTAAGEYEITFKVTDGTQPEAEMSTCNLTLKINAAADTTPTAPAG